MSTWNDTIIFVLWLIYIGVLDFVNCAIPETQDVNDIHRQLYGHELRHVFGVEKMHEVPNYDLVTLKPSSRSSQYDNNNNGNKSDVESSSSPLELKFNAFDDDYHLLVEENEKLLSPDLISVIRNGSKSKLYHGLPKSSRCHYRGRVLSHGNASVALSLCGVTRATIVMPHHFLVIHPLPERLKDNGRGDHVIFKRSPSLSPPLSTSIQFREDVKLNELPASEFCEVKKIDNNRTKPIIAANEDYDDDPPAKTSSRLEILTLELALFLDAQLWTYFVDEFGEKRAEQELIDFSLALINNVYLLYQETSMVPKLDIILVRFELWKTQPEPLDSKHHKSGEAQLFLDAFCTYQTKLNVGTDADATHWDHATLLTGYNIYHSTPSVAGVAPVARMCDPTFSCSLVEGMHLGRSFVLAHEMGHNLGMVHDGVQNQCSKSCCLMSAVNGAGKTTWSPCSVNELTTYVASLGKNGSPPNCLADAAQAAPAKDHKKNGLLPGQRYSADQQCTFFWGKGYHSEIPAGKSKSEICYILWCSNGGSTISTAHPGLEGTWCGDKNWCVEGNCSPWPTENSPKPINGVWSEWSSLPQKNTLCSECKVDGGIRVRREMRNCDNPAPNNGGADCAGSFIRGFVCDGPHICEKFSKQSFADGTCASLKSDPEKPDPELSGKSFQHPTSPCKIWCHLGETQLIRNKGFYPDGTPCGSKKYCVNGECLDLACGGNALVFDSPADCPLQTGSFGWSIWGNWNPCSVTCGAGTQVRKRVCISPNILGSCSGADHENQPCNANVLCDTWRPWSSWGDCSATCNKGIQLRTRICPNGLSCDGRAIESKDCNVSNCPQWALWSDWSICTKSCGSGERSRRRVCERGNDCSGARQESDACNTKPCPEWGPWSGWSTCSESCGNGQTERRRSCLTGSDCDGTVADTQPCKLQDCLPKAQIQWSAWSLCTVSCDGGTQKRQRACLPNDGNGCQGFVTEEQSCNTNSCPSWSSWGLWGLCSSSCGVGFQTRQRICSGSSCSGQDSESKKCLSVPCSPSPSVVGSWQSWDSWSSCSVSCGPGQRTRKRECSIPDQCGGESEDHETCQKYTCISRLDLWGAWEAWSPCSKPCDTGLRQRTRYCRPGAVCPAGGGIEVENCNTHTCSQALWSEWSEWGSCSRTCGEGKISRSRLCLSQDERPCTGVAKEEKTCNQQNCDILVSIKHPEWSSWTQWGDCNCFSNKMIRRRYCKVYEPKILGFCLGPVLDEQDCTPTSCTPLNGGWSDWSEWSSCSSDCGSDTARVRSRLCSNPIPANRGTYCLGQSFEKQSCTWLPSCSGLAVNGGWSDWSDWSACSFGCGRGHRTRARYCDSPSPANGGFSCPGSDFSFESCRGLFQCASSVSGSWGEWSSWAECTQTCGYAFRPRYRQCDSPEPQDGGSYCVGLAYMTKICALPPCPNSVDGGWTAWSAWSDCSSSCGISPASRSRDCTQPNPQNSGIPCLGASAEERNCSLSTSNCVQTLVNFNKHEIIMKKWYVGT